MHIQIQIFAGTLNDKKSNFKTHYIKGYKSYFIVFQKKKKKKTIVETYSHLMK